MSSPTCLLIGGGLASARAAQGLREAGFEGRILLAGDEPLRPYERPPLSKEYLRGEAPLEKLFAHPEPFYADHDVELLPGRSVTSLDPAGGGAELDGGERLRFDRALLATGARPRPLPVPGAGLDGVLTLRTVADADALRERLRGAPHVVVVGAGWIGCEVAASARQLGADVTVIEPLSVPLERVLGPEVGEVYRRLHASRGVRLRCGETVAAVHGDGAVAAVETGGGERIACDLVVVGIGVAPRTELAEAAGLPVDDGVVVDASLRSAGAPNVFAAGDVASAWHPRYGRRVRVEHWANALHQGEAAGRAMAGADVAYDRIPYFYSDQYDLGMEYRGLADPADRVVFRGDPDDGAFVAFWLRDGAVTAAMNANVWDAGDDLAELIASGAAVDPSALADPDTPLAAARSH